MRRKKKGYIDCAEIGSDKFIINDNAKNKEDEKNNALCSKCGGKAYKESYNELSKGLPVKMEIIRCKEKKCKHVEKVCKDSNRQEESKKMRLKQEEVRE